MKTTSLLVPLALAAVLAGCGGSDAVEEPVVVPPPAGNTNTVPASATASVQAFHTFVGAQAASDSAEPLEIGSAVPPESETAEPADLPAA